MLKIVELLRAEQVRLGAEMAAVARALNELNALEQPNRGEIAEARLREDKAAKARPRAKKAAPVATAIEAPKKRGGWPKGKLRGARKPKPEAPAANLVPGGSLADVARALAPANERTADLFVGGSLESASAE
jgi:hypothetical protein